MAIKRKQRICLFTKIWLFWLNGILGTKRFPTTVRNLKEERNKYENICKLNMS